VHKTPPEWKTYFFQSGTYKFYGGQPGDSSDAGIFPAAVNPYPTVLGLARTGLIFNGLQEGAQLGRLIPPGQTEQGIPYHVPSCWVLVGGSWEGGKTHSRFGS